MATATYNRSNILKSAWNLVKTAGKSLSEAMRMAWAEAKLDVVMPAEMVGCVIVNGQKYSSVFVGDGNFGVYVWALVDSSGTRVGSYGEDKKVRWSVEKDEVEESTSTCINDVKEKKPYKVVFTMAGYYSFNEDDILTFLCASSKDASAMKEDGIWNVHIESSIDKFLI